MKSLIICSALVAGLAGCTTQSPLPRQGESIVHLQSAPGFEMLARQQDGQRAPKLNAFTVPSGKHTLEVGIVRTGYQDSHRRCVASLTYEHFGAEQPYTLSPLSSANGLGIALLDKHNNAIARTEKIPCL